MPILKPSPRCGQCGSPEKLRTVCSTTSLFIVWCEACGALEPYHVRGFGREAAPLPAQPISHQDQERLRAVREQVGLDGWTRLDHDTARARGFRR